MANVEKSTKPLYWLRTGTECLKNATPYPDMRSAIQAYRSAARELYRYGQYLETSVHLAPDFANIKECPDFVLFTGKRGGVSVEKA